MRAAKRDTEKRAALEARIGVLAAALGECDDAIAAAATQAEDLAAQLETAYTARAEAEAALDRATTEASLHRAAVAALEGEVAGLRKTLLRRDEALADRATRIDKLVARHAEEEAARAEAEAARERADAQLLQLRAAYESIEREVADLRGALVERGQAVATAADRIDDLAAQLGRSETQRRETEIALESARETAARSAEHAREAEAEAASLRAECANVAASLAAAAEQAQEQRCTAEVTRTELVALKDELAAREGARREAESEAAALLRRVQQGMTELGEAAAGQLMAAEAELAESRSAAESLAAELAIARATLEEREVAGKETNRRFAEVEERLRVAFTDRDAAIARLERQAAEARTAAKASAAELGALRKELHARNLALASAAERIEQTTGETSESPAERRVIDAVLAAARGTAPVRTTGQAEGRAATPRRAPPANRTATQPVTPAPSDDGIVGFAEPRRLG